MTTEEYRKAVAPSEETEQIHLIRWCQWMSERYPELDLIYHIPNEGKRSAVAGGKLKEMGLKVGVPDLCLPVKRGEYNSLYIEMKKLGGKPSIEQIDWLEALEKQGSCVAICEGAEAAEDVIMAYLKNDDNELDKRCLFGRYGDFDKLRPAKRRKKNNIVPGMLIATASMMQIIITVCDALQHRTITGRSFVIGLIVCVLWSCRMITDAYLRVLDYGSEE